MTQRAVTVILGVSVLLIANACKPKVYVDPPPPAVIEPTAAPVTSTDGLPAGFRDAFAQSDARARAIVFYQQCSATVTRLRASGTFGAAATAPKSVHCERTADGVPVGGVFDIDTAFTRARRLTLVRLDGARARYTDAIDTARIVSEAKMVRDVTRDVAAGWRLLKRPLQVVPVVQSDGTIEGWVMPLATKARSLVLGGDIGMTRANATANTFTRIADHLATWKLIAIPPSGAIALASAEREFPAVADLVAARGLAEIGRDVTVSVGGVQSTLTSMTDPSTGSRFSWQHARRTP